ncbi:MAG: tetratricopeptide repeat protein, partial [Longimicrobiales bacterium]|nr:tetratricopeptide repeat protein [Longimicrobiales bacterium]
MSEAVSDGVKEPSETNTPEPGDDLVGAARRRVIEAPDDVEARLQLARLFMERGDAELALEQIDAALEREPENVELLVERGIALTGAARLVDAERELRKAQRLDPERGRVYMQLGRILFKRGLYRQAEVELRRAIE